MAEAFSLRIFTLEKTVYEGSVISFVAPGMDGYFGVLAHHAPLVAALKCGKLSTKDEHGVETVYAMSGGFLEVSSNSAVLLADAIEQASDIDLRRAEAAKERAARRLSAGSQDIDLMRAEAAFSRALNRIKIYQSETPDYSS